MTTQVDFDYNGPPVNVSNGMALQLVSQFGVRNAWFAFLKLRGMKLNNEEAERAEQSYVYFRNKIGHLRREATELNSAESATGIKGEKIDTLINADFDTFLTTADSLELRSDAPTYAEVDEKELLFNNAAELLNENQNGTAPPTTASLLQVIEQSKSIKRQKCQLGQEIGEEQHDGTNKNNNGPDESEQEKQQQHKKDQNDDKQLQQEQSEDPQTLTIVEDPTGNEGNAAESNPQKTITIGDLIKKQTTSANELPLPPTAKTQKPTGKSNKSKGVTTEKDDAETKQVVEKLLAAKEEIAKRHAETIDDVVSLVMEKIRNNQPFEGELAVGTVSHTGPGPSKSHHHHKKTAPATNTTSGQKQAAPKGGASHKKKGGGATQPIDESQLQPGVFGTAEILQRQQAQQMTINTNASISSGLSAGAPIMATAPAGTFGHFPPGQSIVLLHNPVSGTVELPAYSVAQAATTSSSKLHGGQQQQHYQVYPSHHLQPFPQPSTDQMTILSNYPNFIHSSNTLTTTTTTSKMGTSGIYSQQQHIGQVMEHQNGMPLLQCQNAGVAMPVEMAIQQNMTVQELIQTLKSQSRHQNTQIILHHPPNANLAPQPQATSNRSQLPHNRQQHLQQQQETPDSSSQEASMLEAQKQAEIKEGNNIAISASALPKKGRKRKLATTGEQATFTGAAPLVATHQSSSPIKQQKTQQKSAQKNESLDATVKKMATIIEKKEEPIMESIAAKKSTKSKKGKQSEKQERIDDLESQLRKVNKQLTTEHNKFSGQKKRIEKLQAELDKTLDSIQLLQIDLACQKTDNNNLIAENIALKAENQQLRSKGQRATAAAPSSSAIASISAQTDSAVESNNIVGGYRGRKKKANESAEEQTTKMVKRGRGKKIVTPIFIEEKSSLLPLPERTQTPPPLSMELGRRQSKRICVARNQFMKNLF